MDPSEQPPASPPVPECRRSKFLEVLLHDEEHGRLGPVEDYLVRFPDIAGFVQAEYLAFGAPEELRPPGEHGLPEDCGRYRFTRRLGEGGMGIVHEALDTELGRRVVIKTLRPEVSANVQAGERLRREACVLGRLEHPNLAKVIDLLEVDGRMHLVMPFHDGRTLAQCIQEARTRSETTNGDATAWPKLGPSPGRTDRGHTLRQIVRFFARCAEALHSAHRTGVVHRDLKPQNLLVARDGSCIVLDFGLALPASDERLTIAGELMGTPLYMAPEQIEGHEVDARTDVYALGVTLYETLTLVHPFAGPGGRAAVFQRILAGDAVWLRRHQPLLSRDLEAVVLRAIDRQPRRRYQDMDAFARDLQRVIDLQPTEARPVSRLDMALRKVQRRPLVSVLVVLLAVAVGVAVWNQVRIDYLKEDARTLQQILNGPGTSAQKEAWLLEAASVMLKRSPTDDHIIHLLYPEGRVPSVDRFEWVGDKARDSARPHILLRHTFLVEVFDDMQVVASWLYEQPAETRICACKTPTSWAPLPDRAYRWRVSLAGYKAVGEPGHDPEQLADDQSVTVDELRKVLNDAEGGFVIDRTPAPELRPDFGTLEARVQGLLAKKFAADALLVLAGATREHAAQLGSQRQRELIDAAIQILGEPARMLAALASIEPQERLR